MKILVTKDNVNNFHNKLSDAGESRTPVEFLGTKFYIRNVSITSWMPRGVPIGVEFDIDMEECTPYCPTPIVKGLMQYDPLTGVKGNVFPSEAEQYRKWHGKVAWLYNPYTGKKRDARDIGSDVFGHLIEG